MSATVFVIVTFLYLGIVAFLGYLGWKHTKNTKDYMVAGKEMHPFIMALSYGATFISTSAIVGFGGAASLFGLGLMWLVFMNIFVGIFIAFAVFGKRVHALAIELDTHTFPELIGRALKSRFAQGFAGAVIFIFMPLYAAAVMIGGARFLEESLKLRYDVALAILVLIIAIHVIAGGLKGVMYTDAFQGVLMFVGMIALLYITYRYVGGITEGHIKLTNLKNMIPAGLKAKGIEGWTEFPKSGSPMWWVLVSSLIAGVGIGVLAQPQLAVRFMTVKTTRELNRAVLVGGIFILGVVGSAYIVGALSNVFFYETMGKISFVAADKNIDKVIPLYISKATPQWFVYLFMLSLISAAMSTSSSQFHTMGTALSRDIVEETFEVRKVDTVTMTRIGIGITILVSTILAYVLPTNIIARATALFFGLCASTFLPAYMVIVFARKYMSRKWAVASMVVGFTLSLFWLLFVHAKEAQAFGIKPILPYPWVVVDPIFVSFPIALLVAFVPVIVNAIRGKTNEDVSGGDK